MNYTIIKKLGMWLKDVVMLPRNFAKITSIYTNLETQKELSKTQQRLEKAEKCLARDAAIKARRMFFCNNVFWAEDANSDIEGSPYCPRCFELDGNAIHLVVWKNSRGDMIAKCLECKNDEILFRLPE